jgi:hypothetical protein
LSHTQMSCPAGFLHEVPFDNSPLPSQKLDCHRGSITIRLRLKATFVLPFLPHFLALNALNLELVLGITHYKLRTYILRYCSRMNVCSVKPKLQHDIVSTKAFGGALFFVARSGAV